MQIKGIQKAQSKNNFEQMINYCAWAANILLHLVVCIFYALHLSQKVLKLLKYISKLHSVLFLGFRYFGLRDINFLIYKRITIRIRISIFSSDMDT